MRNKKLLTESRKILSEGLCFHLIEGIGIDNNIYRPGSSKYFNLFREVRDLSDMGLYELNSVENYYINETDIGEFGFYNGDLVPLDYPIIEGDESLKPSVPLEVLEEKKKAKKTANIRIPIIPKLRYASETNGFEILLNQKLCFSIK